MSICEEKNLRVGTTAVLTYTTGSITFIALTLRGKNCRSGWGNWQLVSGGCNTIENPKDCIIREAKEEVDLDIKIVNRLPDYILNTDDGKWLTINYVCSCEFPHYLKNNEPEKFDDIKWIDINYLPKNISRLSRMLINDFLTKEFCDDIGIVDD